MSSLIALPTRAFIAARTRLIARNEQGAVSIEYMGVLLIAAALALAVLALVLQGGISGLLSDILGFVLRRAATMLKG